MKKKILLSLAAIVLVFAIWALMNREKFTQAVVDLGMALTSSVKHRDPSTEKAKFEMSTAAFLKEYKANPTTAAAKYINQTVLLEGDISAISGITVSFEGIACNIDSTQVNRIKELSVGSKVKIQGLVVGYNDLMEEVSMAQCTLK